MNARPALIGAMPIILTERQEQFAQQILIGKAASTAYQIAYGVGIKAAEANGSRLIRSHKVAARIEQLRADHAAAVKITVPYLTRELIATAKEARAVAQYAAASGAYGLVAKMHGLLVDKVAVEHTVRKPSAEPLSPDEMSETDWLGKHGLTIEGSVSDSLPTATDTILTTTDSGDHNQGH